LDDARRARMRSRVLDAIPDDPAPRGSVLQAEAPVAAGVDLTGAQTLEIVPSGPDPRPSRSRTRPHWSSGRRLLVAAAVAAVLGLVAVVAGASRSPDHQIGTLDQSSPRVTLESLAQAVAGQPDVPLAAGQYQFIESTQADRLDGGGFDLTVDDNWHTIDGSGRRRTTLMTRPAGGQPGSEIDRRTVPMVEDSAGLPWFGPFSYDGMRSAPTDPTELLAAAAAATPGQPDWAVAEQIAFLEAQTTAPPAVRAAGLRALAQLDYRPIGLVTDPLGRSGVGFQADTPDGVEVLAFDQATGRAFGYWSVPAGTTPTVDAATRWVAWAHGEVTDTAG
ncbi:MAG: hypothetical protein ACXV5S_02030, partial [Acidimicrobiales bacterium]